MGDQNGSRIFADLKSVCSYLEGSQLCPSLSAALQVAVDPGWAMGRHPRGLSAKGSMRVPEHSSAAGCSEQGPASGMGGKYAGRAHGAVYSSP